MADRTTNLGLLHTKNASSLTVETADIGETMFRADLVMMKTDGKVYQTAPTEGAVHAGYLVDAGVTTASLTATIANDPNELLKAVVKTTDALSDAARGLRIKGAGGSDALVQSDLGEEVFGEDSRTIKTASATPTANAVRVGRVVLIDLTNQIAWIRQDSPADPARAVATLQLTQDAAATDSLTMGRVPFAGTATGHVESPLASAGGESYSVQFQKNGVNLGSAVVIAASTAAFTSSSGSLGTVAADDIIEADITLAGGSTLARMSVAVTIQA